jgi:hypothetical protein
MCPSPVNWGMYLRYYVAGRAFIGRGKTKGAYLAANILAIMFLGGLAPAIGI